MKQVAREDDMFSETSVDLERIAQRYIPERSGIEVDDGITF
jgi:hypothetical protein